MVSENVNQYLTGIFTRLLIQMQVDHFIDACNKTLKRNMVLIKDHDNVFFVCIWQLYCMSYPNKKITNAYLQAYYC